MIRLFRALIPGAVLALILSEAAIICACYVLATYWTQDFSADVFLWDGRGLLRIAIVCLLIILVLHLQDLYDGRRIRSRIALVQQFCLALGAAFVFQALFSYGEWNVILPKWLMVYGSGLVLIVTPVWHIVYSSTIARSLGSERMLFVGSSDAIQEIFAEILRRPELGLVTLGYLDVGENGRQVLGMERLGTVEELSEILAKNRPDRIVIDSGDIRRALPVERLLELRTEGVRIEDARTTYESVFHRVSTHDLPPFDLVLSKTIAPRRMTLALQSIYSRLIGAALFLVLSPLILLIAAFVKLSSPGPAVMRRTLLGRDGKHFTHYEFRVTRHNTEEVTTVGGWLRKLGLAGLPQLLNVVRGEMSIVGPRPDRPEFMEFLQQRIPFYPLRFRVKPGMVGWAQLHRAQGDGIEDTLVNLEYDLYYIKNLSVPIDLFVMFDRLKALLRGRGGA